MRAALRNSKVVQKRNRELSVLPMKTFHPTQEQFANPMEYIRSIEARASQYGVVKIVPPSSWKPPKQLFPTTGLGVSFATKSQPVHRLQQGVPFPDGRHYSAQSFHRMATAFVRNRFPMFQLDRIVKGTAQDVGRWQEVPAALSRSAAAAEHAGKPRSGAGATTHEVHGAGPAPTAVPADATFETADDWLAEVEREYWRVVETSPYELAVEYGSDIPTHKVVSGFTHVRPAKGQSEEDFIRTKVEALSTTDEGTAASTTSPTSHSNWNLHNLPFVPGSLLRHHDAIVSGINVPWLYFGMLFSSFAWHVEDNWLFSVSYMHMGSPKVWYGVPSSSAAAFERTIKSHVHTRFRDSPQLLHDLVTVLSPNVLRASGIPVYRGVHNPGEFIVTFPRAYHAGFNTGFNCAEAVNFAVPSWFPMGQKCVEQYRSAARTSVLCFPQLVLSIARRGEERSVSECQFALAQLGRLRETEEIMRAQAIRSGAVRAHVGHRTRGRPECSVCKQLCFLSVLTCRRCPTKMACLAHGATMCDCGMAEKVMVTYIRMASLDALVERLRKRQQKFEKREQRRKRKLQKMKQPGAAHAGALVGKKVPASSMGGASLAHATAPAAAAKSASGHHLSAVWRVSKRLRPQHSRLR